MYPVILQPESAKQRENGSLPLIAGIRLMQWFLFCVPKCCFNPNLGFGRPVDHEGICGEDIPLGPGDQFFFLRQANGAHTGMQAGMDHVEAVATQEGIVRFTVNMRTANTA